MTMMLVYVTMPKAAPVEVFVETDLLACKAYSRAHTLKCKAGCLNQLSCSGFIQFARHVLRKLQVGVFRLFLCVYCQLCTDLSCAIGI